LDSIDSLLTCFQW